MCYLLTSAMSTACSWGWIYWALICDQGGAQWGDHQLCYPLSVRQPLHGMIVSSMIVMGVVALASSRALKPATCGNLHIKLVDEGLARDAHLPFQMPGSQNMTYNQWLPREQYGHLKSLGSTDRAHTVPHPTFVITFEWLFVRNCVYHRHYMPINSANGCYQP